MKFSNAVERALAAYAKQMNLTREEALIRIVSGWLIGAGYLSEREPQSIPVQR